MLPERRPTGWQIMPHDARLLDGRLEPVPSGYMLLPEGRVPKFNAPCAPRQTSAGLGRRSGI